MVDEDLLELLQTTVFFNNQADRGDHNADSVDENEGEEIGVSCLLERQLLAPTDSPERFVEEYAKINIVKNEVWIRQRMGRIDRSIGVREDLLSIYPETSAELYSKDPPEPYIFACLKNPGCKFITPHSKDIVEHVKVCNPALVAKRQQISNFMESGGGFPCHYDGCSKVFMNHNHLRYHIKDIHKSRVDWVPIPCEHGCNPNKLFDSAYNYDRHQRDKHSGDGRYPTSCTVAECTTPEKTFSNQSYYRRHLENDHGITDAKELQKYLPPQASKRRWIKGQPCPTGLGCILAFENPREMQRHLTGRIHGMTEDDAAIMVEHKDCYEIVMKPAKVVEHYTTLGKTARAVMQGKRKAANSGAD